MLNIDHALGNVGDAVKGVWGKTDGRTPSRIEAGHRALLAEGKTGSERWLTRAFDELPAGRDADPLVTLAAYFAKHPTRVSYADRLAASRSIGSGAVEGAIKQQVNLCLKWTGVRWRTEHLGPLLELRALSLTLDWQGLWATAA